LAAQLWEPSTVESLVKEIKSAPLLKVTPRFTAEVEAICSYVDKDTEQLQRYVRTQFLSVPKSHWGTVLESWIAYLVLPSVQVHIPTWDARVVKDYAHVIASKLRSKELATLDEVNLKLACKVAAGALDAHPMVQGILIACVEQGTRASRGIYNMKGLKLSDAEMQCMSEAGVALAMAASNKSLLQTFGLSFAAPKLPLSNLFQFGLPEPFLAVDSPDIIKQNSHFIGSSLRAPPSSKQLDGDDDEDLPLCPSTRHLVLAFDKTYILQGIDLVQLRRGRGYVGTSLAMEVLAQPDGDHDPQGQP
jgi:hypothetical protein